MMETTRVGIDSAMGFARKNGWPWDGTVIAVLAFAQTHETEERTRKVGEDERTNPERKNDGAQIDLTHAS